MCDDMIEINHNKTYALNMKKQEINLINHIKVT